MRGPLFIAAKARIDGSRLHGVRASATLTSILDEAFLIYIRLCSARFQVLWSVVF